ncbi:unnamed protein product [Pipistrellus nathusii]|uniref:Uncharacterized protein n=1 Tax=Pipistrellus nathusii TaxID=59473 RepID=A0ABN9ZFS9_PIPNA
MKLAPAKSTFLFFSLFKMKYKQLHNNKKCFIPAGTLYQNLYSIACLYVISRILLPSLHSCGLGRITLGLILVGCGQGGQPGRTGGTDVSLVLCLKSCCSPPIAVAREMAILHFPDSQRNSGIPYCQGHPQIVVFGVISIKNKTEQPGF